MAVVEVNRPNRQLRRRHGKSDPVDAIAAARAAQSGRPRVRRRPAVGAVEAIRALRTARRSAGHARTTALNQMRAPAREWTGRPPGRTAGQHCVRAGDDRGPAASD